MDKRNKTKNITLIISTTLVGLIGFFVLFLVIGMTIKIPFYSEDYICGDAVFGELEKSCYINTYATDNYYICQYLGGRLRTFEIGIGYKARYCLRDN